MELQAKLFEYFQLLMQQQLTSDEESLENKIVDVQMESISMLSTTVVKAEQDGTCINHLVVECGMHASQPCA